MIWTRPLPACPHVRRTVLCLVAALAWTATRGSDAIGEEPGPLTPARLSREQLKNGDAVLRAFRPVVEPVSRSTIRVMSAARDEGARSEKELALGVIIDAEGLALTKASQMEKAIACRLSDGRTVAARVLATDVDTDVALLRLEASGLTPVEWSREAPRAGQWLATASPGKLPVALGVLSGKPRSISAEKGFLGVSVAENEVGPRVHEIIPESSAERAGLKVGDCIVEVAGEAVRDVDTMLQRLGSYRPGTSLSLKIRRNEETVSVETVLGRRPVEGGNRGQFQNSLGGELSLRRDGFATVLPHDTVLRPEDCGGPVVGLNGKTVGMNIARAGRTESYALPVSVIEPLIANLRKSAEMR